MIRISKIVVCYWITLYNFVKVDLDVAQIFFEEVGFKEEVFGIVEVRLFLNQFLPSSTVGSELAANVQKSELYEQVSQSNHVVVVLDELVVDLLN